LALARAIQHPAIFDIAKQKCGAVNTATRVDLNSEDNKSAKMSWFFKLKLHHILRFFKFQI
jgi:hypothetical protein